MTDYGDGAIFAGVALAPPACELRRKSSPAASQNKQNTPHTTSTLPGRSVIGAVASIKPSRAWTAAIASIARAMPSALPLATKAQAAEEYGDSALNLAASCP
jgi:hypothetical protein